MFRRKIPTLRCSSDFLNGTPMLSMSASSAYGSSSDKSASSCRRVGHLQPSGAGLPPAVGSGLIPCGPEYGGYTHICGAAGGPMSALLTRSCNHLHRRRSVSSLDALDTGGGAPYERPGVTVECRVDCRHVDRASTTAGGVGSQPSASLLPPPPPPLTAYCHDLDLVSSANDTADDSPSFNWPSITA